MSKFNFKATTLSELTPITTYIFDCVVNKDVDNINYFIESLNVRDCSSLVLSSVARSVYKIGMNIPRYKIFLESIVIKFYDSGTPNDMREANKMFSLLRNFPAYDEDVAYGLPEFVAVKKAKNLVE